MNFVRLPCTIEESNATIDNLAATRPVAMAQEIGDGIRMMLVRRKDADQAAGNSLTKLKGLPQNIPHECAVAMAAVHFTGGTGTDIAAVGKAYVSPEVPASKRAAVAGKIALIFWRKWHLGLRARDRVKGTAFIRNNEVAENYPF